MPKKKELFDEESADVADKAVEVEPVAPKKKTKETPEERKERLKSQLAKGREKALANRKKNALVKKVAKKEEEEKKDALLAEKLLGQESSQKEILQLKEELKALKETKKEVTEERKEVSTIEEKKEKTTEINDLKKQINLLAGVVDRLIKERNKDKVKMEYIENKEEPEPKKAEVTRPPTPQVQKQLAIKVFDVTHSMKKPRFL